MSRRTLGAAVVVVAAVAVSLGFFWPFGSDSNTLTVPGTVEVQEIHLGSKVGGRVEELFVHEGDEVEAGKELLRFEAPELTAQRDQLIHRVEGAKADLLKAENGSRKQEIEEAKAMMEAAKARQERMVNGWREEEKRQAKYDLDNAQSDLELAQKLFDRFDKLLSQVSPTEYDTAHFRLISARAKFNAARAKFEMISVGNRSEDKAEADAEMRRTKMHYELLVAGTREEDKALARAQVAELEAKLCEINANLNETLLRAPSKIVVEVVAVRKGDVVAPMVPVVRALQADDRWVKVFLPSTELGKVHRGDAVDVTCDSYPGKKFKGTIIQIATISEFTPRNVQSLDERRHQVFGVKVRVDDADVFKAGMAAEVRIPLKGTP